MQPLGLQTDNIGFLSGRKNAGFAMAFLRLWELGNLGWSGLLLGCSGWCYGDIYLGIYNYGKSRMVWLVNKAFGVFKLF